MAHTKKNVRIKHPNQQPTGPSKQPIITHYLGHLTAYQPIRDQYFLGRSVPDPNVLGTWLTVNFTLPFILTIAAVAESIVDVGTGYLYLRGTPEYTLRETWIEG